MRIPINIRLLLRTALGVVFLVLLSSSCTVERQIGKKFAGSWTPPALMLIPPNYVLKENLKKEYLADSLDRERINLDSLRFEQSLYLKDINDSIFLDGYMNAMISSLRKLGFVVYMPTSLDTFLTYQGEAYILDLAQVMIEEFESPITEKEVFDETIYYKKFNLNTISISSWFELSQINVAEDDRKLLFASHKIKDNMQGKFTQNQFSGEVLYRYSLNPILLQDVYSLGITLGKKYAGYLYDYFLNRHISNELPEGTYPDTWYHLDQNSGKLIRDWDDFFIELDPQNK